jgi:ADP-ribose pyrophosphatase YjhB (NUDIX family)
MTPHYCFDCGSMLEMRLIEARDREVCPKCGWIHYAQRKLSAGVRIEVDGRLLLVQRRIQPWIQKWYLPAGFVEVDEEPEHAAVREAFEETGLTVKVLGLAGTYTYSDDPRGNGLVLIYDANIEGGELKITPETLQAGFFTPEEIRNMEFAGASVDRQIRDWLNRNLIKETAHS